jgi:hypothetical protein
VDPVPDRLLLRKSGSAGNRTRASGSVGWNSKQCLETLWNTTEQLSTATERASTVTPSSWVYPVVKHRETICFAGSTFRIEKLA